MPQEAKSCGFIPFGRRINGPVFGDRPVTKRQLQSPRAWVIDAVWFLAEEIARAAVSSRPASAADVPVFADAALSLELRGVAKAPENWRFTPDFFERSASDVAGGQRKVAARKDLPRVGNEADALPGEAAPGYG